MKDNDLLILLLIIIVVGIIYYIYKCFCNNKKIKEKFNKTSSKSSNKSNEKFETPPQPPPISCQLEFLNYSELPFSIKHKNTNSYLSIGPICFFNSDNYNNNLVKLIDYKLSSTDNLNMNLTYFDLNERDNKNENIYFNTDDKLNMKHIKEFNTENKTEMTIINPPNKHNFKHNFYDIYYDIKDLLDGENKDLQIKTDYNITVKSNSKGIYLESSSKHMKGIYYNNSYSDIEKEDKYYYSDIEYDTSSMFQHDTLEKGIEFRVASKKDKKYKFNPNYPQAVLDIVLVPVGYKLILEYEQNNIYNSTMFMKIFKTSLYGRYTSEFYDKLKHHEDDKDHNNGPTYNYYDSISDNKDFFSKYYNNSDDDFKISENIPGGGEIILKDSQINIQELECADYDRIDNNYDLKNSFMNGVNKRDLKSNPETREMYYNITSKPVCKYIKKFKVPNLQDLQVLDDSEKKYLDVNDDKSLKTTTYPSNDKFDFIIDLNPETTTEVKEFIINSTLIVYKDDIKIDNIKSEQGDYKNKDIHNLLFDCNNMTTITTTDNNKYYYVSVSNTYFIFKKDNAGIIHILEKTDNTIQYIPFTEIDYEQPDNYISQKYSKYKFNILNNVSTYCPTDPITEKKTHVIFHNDVIDKIGTNIINHYYPTNNSEVYIDEYNRIVIIDKKEVKTYYLILEKINDTNNTPDTYSISRILNTERLKDNQYIIHIKNNVDLQQQEINFDKLCYYIISDTLLQQEQINNNEIRDNFTSTSMKNQYYKLQSDTGEFLHVKYSNENYTFELREDLKFYSVYDDNNNSLIESYSPYLLLENNKKFKFLIGNKTSNSKDKIENVTLNVKEIDFQVNVITEENILLLNLSESNNATNILNYIEYITNKYELIEFNNENKNDDTIEILETLDDKKTELIGDKNDLINSQQNENENLDGQIRTLDNQIVELNNTNNNLKNQISKNITYYKNVINTNIKPKINTYIDLIDKIYIISQQILKVKKNYQSKTKLYFSIKDNTEYKKELDDKIENLRLKKDNLEKELENPRKEYLNNSFKINNIIKEINNYIQKIQKIEHFTSSDQDFSLNVEYNNKLREINKEYIEKQKELENLINYNNTKTNKKNETTYRKETYKKHNEYLEIYIKFYGNDNEYTDTNDITKYTYKKELSVFFSKFDEEIEKLNKNLIKKQQILANWKLKYQNSELVNINYNNVTSEIQNKEFDLINLQREFNNINKKIDNTNVLLKAENQLDNIKNVYYDIKNKNTNYFENFANFKSAESHNNQFLSLIPQNNDQYKIRVNDKCLNVYGSNDNKLENCNTNSQSQLFYRNLIQNNSDALYHNKNQPYQDSIVNYPYEQLKSVITDDCINVDSDGIFTNTCDSNNIKQRWNLNTDEKLCLDN